MNWALAKPRALELLPHVACFGVVCMLSACARHFLAEMLELAAARLSEVLGTWRTEVVVATVGSAWVVSRTRSLPFVTGLQRQMLQLLVAGGSLQALGKAQAADASSKQACCSETPACWSEKGLSYIKATLKVFLLPRMTLDMLTGGQLSQLRAAKPGTPSKGRADNAAANGAPAQHCQRCSPVNWCAAQETTGAQQQQGATLYQRRTGSLPGTRYCSCEDLQLQIPTSDSAAGAAGSDLAAIQCPQYAPSAASSSAQSTPGMYSPHSSSGIALESAFTTAGRQPSRQDRFSRLSEQRAQRYSPGSRILGSPCRAEDQQRRRHTLLDCSVASAQQAQRGRQRLRQPSLSPRGRILSAPDEVEMPPRAPARPAQLQLCQGLGASATGSSGAAPSSPQAGLLHDPFAEAMDLLTGCSPGQSCLVGIGQRSAVEPHSLQQLAGPVFAQRLLDLPVRSSDDLDQLLQKRRPSMQSSHSFSGLTGQVGMRPEHASLAQLRLQHQASRSWCCSPRDCGDDASDASESMQDCCRSFPLTSFSSELSLDGLVTGTRSHPLGSYDSELSLDGLVNGSSFSFSSRAVSRRNSLAKRPVTASGITIDDVAAVSSSSRVEAASHDLRVDHAGPAPAVDPRVVGTAVESLGQDHGCAELIQQLIPEDYLLQFGAALGEEPSQAALVRRALPGAWGQPGSVFGMPDNGHDPDQAWEHILEESTSTLAYWAWRKPHRAGLYAYRTHVVMEGITAPQLRDFNLNDAARFTWDESMLEIEKLPLPTGSHGESKLAQYRAKFPRPMAARDYIYGRRVWGRPSDGGCYVVNVGLDLPGVLPPGRSVPVKDYISLSVVRACASCKGYPEGAAEVITMYFEDPGVRAGIMNIAIRKGLWAFVQKHEAGLREYLAAKQARAERLVRRKSLGGRGSPRAGGRSEPASSIPSSSEYDSETGSEDASYTHSHYAHQRSHHGRRRRRLIPGIRPRKLLLSSLGMVGKVVSSVLFLESGRNEYYYGSDV